MHQLIDIAERMGESNMSALQEEFSRSVALIILKAIELGYQVTMGEAWRTPEQAQWNADHHVGIAHSLHMERLAIDLNLFKDGVFLTDPAPYVELGTWWKSYGAQYRFGGDFAIKDYDHFSITPDGVRG